MFKKPQHILITGASSGLGAALACAYAAPNVVLSLLGRDEARLCETARLCEEKGAKVTLALIDVCDREKTSLWVKKCFQNQPIDLVIANAGISANTGGKVNDFEIAHHIFDVNFYGILNILHPALELMRLQKRGQIALMSSLAGFRGAPQAGAYCASKAAIRVYGESLRAEMALEGIQINVICPGFIKTPLTDKNTFRMPFLMPAKKAARIIQIGLAANKAQIAFPAATFWLAKLYAALPACWPFSIIDRKMVQLPPKHLE